MVFFVYLFFECGVDFGFVEVLILIVVMCCKLWGNKVLWWLCLLWKLFRLFIFKFSLCLFVYRVIDVFCGNIIKLDSIFLWVFVFVVGMLMILLFLFLFSCGRFLIGNSNICFWLVIVKILLLLRLVIICGVIIFEFFGRLIKVLLLWFFDSRLLFLYIKL